MKTKLTPHLVVALFCFAIAVLAGPLPNAWQITDDSPAPGSTLTYTNILPAGLKAAATNAGFDFSINARFVTGFGSGSQTMAVVYSDGATRWEILWSLTNGDLVSELITNVSPVAGETFVVTTNDTGRALYHTHEIVYDPASRLASYLVDGQALTTNWPGSTAAGLTAGQVLWSAVSSAGEGAMNFHSISFVVTNGDAAAYDAGTEPTNAPDPVTQGWTKNLGTGTSATGISPDRGPDVVTTLADSGYGSLRQTIADARPGDIIIFTTNGTLSLTSSELSITNDLTIAGPGPSSLALSGMGNRRIFNLSQPGATVSISGLTIEDGLGPNGPDGSSAGSDGGSGGNGGGIYNGGALTLSNCVIAFNAAGTGGNGVNGAGGTGPLANNKNGGSGGSGGQGGNGGGIYNYEASLTLVACTFSHNSSGSGGNAGDGGNAYNLSNGDGGDGGQGGQGGSGGGIDNYFGTITQTSCTFSYNQAGYGGSIGNGGSGGSLGGNNGGSGGNGDQGDGGGIFSDGTLTLNNSTISGNSAAYGGGIIFFGTNTLNNSTISGNSAIAGGGIDGIGMTLTNTIVAGNAGGDINGSASGRNNLIGTDPQLAPLSNYGGPTQTMRPLFGSPAIDAGDDLVTSFLATDQRGFPRKSGAHVDIGAVEAHYASANDPPLLTNPAVQANGALLLGFTNDPGMSFQVLTSTNVALPLDQWTDLGTATEGLPGEYRFSDPTATNFPHRFYRVVSP